MKRTWFCICIAPIYQVFFFFFFFFFFLNVRTRVQSKRVLSRSRRLTKNLCRAKPLKTYGRAGFRDCGKECEKNRRWLFLDNKAIVNGWLGVNDRRIDRWEGIDDSLQRFPPRVECLSTTRRLEIAAFYSYLHWRGIIGVTVTFHLSPPNCHVGVSIAFNIREKTWAFLLSSNETRDCPE